ncbi:hypothetical protein Tco_0475370 [Tanacetum coccineum]
MNNDVNALRQFPIFNDLKSGKAPDVPFVATTASKHKIDVRGVSPFLRGDLQELYTTFSTLAGKFRCRGISWVFDLNTSGLCPSYVEGLTANPGLGPFAWDGFPILVSISKTVLCRSKLFEGFKVQSGKDLIRARRGGLQAGEEGPESPVEIYRLKYACVLPSWTWSYRDDPRQKAWKVPAQASKVAGDASTPLDVDSELDIHEFPSAKELKDATDCHWVVAHVTPPSWKQYLMEISIEQICDIHDKAYMRRRVLGHGVRNELIEKIFLHCIKPGHPVILFEKGKSRKIKRMQSWRKNDIAAVVARVISDATMKLIHSDEMGVLIARLVKASIIHGRCGVCSELGMILADASLTLYLAVSEVILCFVEQLLVNPAPEPSELEVMSVNNFHAFSGSWILFFASPCLLSPLSVSSREFLAKNLLNLDGVSLKISSQLSCSIYEGQYELFQFWFFRVRMKGNVLSTPFERTLVLDSWLCDDYVLKTPFLYSQMSITSSDDVFRQILFWTSNTMRISSLSACRASLAILCYSFLPSSISCGKSDLTMTKLSVFVTVRRPSLIVISKGTSPKGQAYSSEKPTSEVFESTRRDLIDGFNFKKQCL